MTIDKIKTKLESLLASHPLICECGSWKHAEEVICEQCRIDITVENTSVL